MYHESDEEAFFQMFACRLFDGAYEDLIEETSEDLFEATYEDMEFSTDRFLAMIFDEAKRKSPERYRSARKHFLFLEKGSEEKIKQEIAKADAVGMLYYKPL